MTKSATFGVMHIGIAFCVSYALTGSVAIAGAITFVEPLVNTVAHYFFEKAWESGRLGGGQPRLTRTVYRPAVRAEPVACVAA